ncbi:hypothetical protein M8494_15200 [Serratia ureilytica]
MQRGALFHVGRWRCAILNIFQLFGQMGEMLLLSASRFWLCDSSFQAVDQPLVGFVIQAEGQ